MASADGQHPVRTAAHARPMTTTDLLPSPSISHATCAWCRTDFPSIAALLCHVDHGHLESAAAPVLHGLRSAA